MTTIVHLLPHPGGGGETVVDTLIQDLDEHEHERLYLSRARDPLRAAPSLAVGVPRAALASRKADLLHVVGDTAALLTLPLLKRRRSVFGTHGLHLMRRTGAAGRRGVRSAALAADRTVCSSRSERDELSQLVPSAARDRIVAVPNGIPVPALASTAEREAARSDLGLGPDQVAALFLGQLEARKDPLLAVEAAVTVAGRGLPLVLLVAGDGPLIDQVRGEGVRALGFRRDPERLLAAADVFVLPSAREGLSLALLEAMGHGLPCVVSAEPGNREAVGDAGRVHPVGDAAALAEILAELVASPDERARLGAAARARVQERFTVERFLEDMRQVLDEVLAR